MADTFAVGGLIALCCLLLPLSGWWLASRLRDDSLFRFIAACLAGVTTLAVAELTVFALRLPQWAAVTMVASTCAASLRPVIQAIRRREFAWDALLTWAGASAILAAATLRYGVHGLPGAVWDWYEHWLRALIFLMQAPVTTDIGIYWMPSRGPLFNGAAALLLYLAGSAHFWVFQIFATTFNVLVCLPFALFLRTIGGVSRRTALLIGAAVTVVVPFYFWNNTFTWTKDLTAAFVLLGIHEYLVSYRKGSRDGMAMSLAYLAPGFLCHYLALLYALMLGLHLLLVVPLRALPLRALTGAGLLWGVLIGPWFGFMMLNFGVKKTLGANSTVGRYYASKDAQGHTVPLRRVLIANMCVDFLPYSVCRPLLPPENPAFCRTVTVNGAGVVQSEEPCSNGYVWNGPNFAWKGIYSVLRYSGLLVVLIAAAGSARPLLSHFRGLILRTKRRVGAGQDGWFLLWVLTVGFIINLLPLRWFDMFGSFGENLHAWLFVFSAVVVRGLLRIPRPAVAVLLLAMAAEFGRVDLNLIRAQTGVLPMANHQQAMRGQPPLGTDLPVLVTGAGFQASKDYYQNYLIKVTGGAAYFRDTHPASFAAVSWMILLLGVFGVAAGRWLAADESVPHSQQDPLLE